MGIESALLKQELTVPIAAPKNRTKGVISTSYMFGTDTALSVDATTKDLIPKNKLLLFFYIEYAQKNNNSLRHYYSYRVGRKRVCTRSGNL
jgi:hypothetical protein